MGENISEYMGLMALYLEGKCTPEQTAELREWVSASEENMSAFDSFRNVWETEHPAFSPDGIDAAKARAELLSSAAAVSGVRRRGFSWWWRSVAAVLLLPLLCWCAALSYEKYAAPSPEASMQTFATPYGVYAEVMLPDSSLVCLNSASRLVYPSFFDGKERRVSLDGEAYFKVKSDAGHPFIVSAKDVEIRATGTEFNVEAYSETSQRVTLVSGKLDVDACGKRYSVPAGCQLFRDSDNSVSCFQTETFKWTAWRQGMLAFRGDRLSYVFERLSAIYNVAIVIKDSGVSDCRIRATFRNEKIDEIMSLVSRTAPVRVVRNEVERDGVRTTEYCIYSK